MSNYPQGIAALPAIVRVLRSQFNNLIGALDGSNPSKIRLSHNDQDGFVIQCHSTLTETAANRALALYAKADTIGVSAAQFDVNYDGDVHCDKLTADEAVTITGAATFNGGITTTTLTASGNIDGNGATNTLAGTVRLGDDLANYHEFIGAATTARPRLTFTGSDTNVGGDLRTKGIGVLYFFLNRGNYFYLDGANTGSDPSWNCDGGDVNVGLNFVPKGSGKIKVGGNRILTLEGDLPSGSQFVLWQASAPTGWTRVNTGFNSGSLLAFSTGAVGTGNGGGTASFGTAFGASTTGNEATHTHTVGSHTHAQNMGASVPNLIGAQQVFTSGSSGSGDELRASSGGAGTSYLVQSGVQASSGTSGAGAAHNHTTPAYTPYYELCLIASKNA